MKSDRFAIYLTLEFKKLLLYFMYFRELIKIILNYYSQILSLF